MKIRCERRILVTGSINFYVYEVELTSMYLMGFLDMSKYFNACASSKASGTFWN